MTEKLQDRIEHIEAHLALARACLRLNEKGFAVRYYDIQNDQQAWRHGDDRWISMPLAHLKFPPCIRDADLTLIPVSCLQVPATYLGPFPHEEIVSGEAHLARYKARLEAGEEYV